MGCCDADHAAPVPEGLTSANLAPPDLNRRTVLGGVAAIAGLLSSAGPAGAQQKELKKLKLAFCSQILCIVPYEVARAQGHWRNHGLDVELVYTRGGGAAMQALVGGAVDYAATALDVAIQAYAKGAEIRRFATTGRLPLFALVTAPKAANTITDLKSLEGKTVAESWNGDFKGDLTFPIIRKLLQERYPGIRIVPYDKLPYLYGADDPAQQKALAKRIAARAKELECDAVISGNGA